MKIPAAQVTDEESLDHAKNERLVRRASIGICLICIAILVLVVANRSLGW